MDLLTLFLFSAVVGSGSCSPLQPAVSAAAGGPPARTPPKPPAQPGARDGAHAPREALNLAPHDTVVIHPLPTNGGCTTTLSETYGYPCSWDGTTTIYPYTTILYQQINCSGCENLHVVKDYYHCPNQRINGTQYRDTPSTLWSTICRPTAVLARRTQLDDAPATTTPSDGGAPQTAAPVLNPTVVPTPSGEAAPQIELA